MTRWLTRLSGCVICFLALATPARAERDQIVIVAGAPSHGYGEHETRAGAELIRTALRRAEGSLEVVILEAWPRPGSLDRAAALVLSFDGDRRHLALPHLEQIDRHVAQGMGVMALHWAVHVPKGAAGEALTRWIGGYYESDYSTNPKWSARIGLDAAHPISRGVDPVEIHDEWYFNIRFPEAPPGLPAPVPVATAVPTDQDRARVSSFWPWASPPAGIAEASGRRETLVWALERADGGRGVGFTGGHYHWNFGNDSFRRLLLNAVLWVAGGDVPENGVVSTPPSFEALRHNQDEREPRGFDAEAVRTRFALDESPPRPVDAR